MAVDAPSRLELQIGGMTCAACAARVEKKLNKLDGVDANVNYATELATAFHAFYRDARVVDPDEPARSAARLALVDATRISLANALALLGISAPESM